MGCKTQPNHNSCVRYTHFKTEENNSVRCKAVGNRPKEFPTESLKTGSDKLDLRAQGAQGME